LLILRGENICKVTFFLLLDGSITSISHTISSREMKIDSPQKLGAIANQK